MVTDKPKHKRMSVGVAKGGQPADAVTSRRVAALAVLCLSVLLVMIDNSIVNVALPTIARDLGASTSGLQWIVDAYTLVFASLLVTCGHLGDRFGRRRLLIVGVVGFVVMSVVATQLNSLSSLIAARAGLGLFAAVVFPTTLAIITSLFSSSQGRAAAVGLWAATAGVAVAIGPVLGGWLLEHYSWAAVFWVNLPIGAIVIVGAVLFVPSSTGRVHGNFDILGLILSAAGIFLLVYGLIEAPNKGWVSVSTVVSLVGALVILTLFILWELRIAVPLLDLRLFAIRQFAAGAAMISVAYFSLFGYIFIIVQYLQGVSDYNTLEAGVRTLPFAGVMAALSPMATYCAQRWGAGRVLALGGVLNSAGFVVALWVTPSTPYWQFLLGSMMLGAAGFAFISGPATAEIMATLGDDQAGAGSAVNDTTRELGGTLGVAVFGSVVGSVYTSRLDTAASFHQLPAQAQAAVHDSIIGGVDVASRLPERAADLLRHAVDAAFVSGMHHAVWVGIVASAIAAPIALKLLPTSRANLKVREESTKGKNNAD